MLKSLQMLLLLLLLLLLLRCLVTAVQLRRVAVFCQLSTIR